MKLHHCSSLCLHSTHKNNLPLTLHKKPKIHQHCVPADGITKDTLKERAQTTKGTLQEYEEITKDTAGECTDNEKLTRRRHR
jgi:hypothetical protein